MWQTLSESFPMLMYPEKAFAQNEASSHLTKCSWIPGGSRFFKSDIQHPGRSDLGTGIPKLNDEEIFSETLVTISFLAQNGCRIWCPRTPWSATRLFSADESLSWALCCYYVDIFEKFSYENLIFLVDMEYYGFEKFRGNWNSILRWKFYHYLTYQNVYAQWCMDDSFW